MALNLSLPGDITIYGVGPLRTQLQGWLADLPDVGGAGALTDSPLLVDGSGVNEVDAAGVQLLLAMSKSLSERHRTLRITDPSGPLSGACLTLGLTAPLLGEAAEGATE